ncbi:MAG: hypothetical protein KJ065_25325 [Anaerolineae bacterium]|nr:hypothetical protein [Anaerolineae bacterium]
MQRLAVCLVVCVAVLLLVPAALAQESMAYGDTVTNSITSDEFAFEYTFEGGEGDVVVVEMRRTNTDEDMTRPEIHLLDSEGEEIATTAETFSYGAAVLVAKLTDSATYTIVATRNDDADGDSVSEFELELIQPTMLEAGADLIDGEIDNDARDQYYYLPADGEVTVLYQPGDSIYIPILSVNVVNQGTLRPLGQIAGVFIEQGTLTIDADEDDIYIVMVAADESDYIFRDVQSEYQLGIAAQ